MGCFIYFPSNLPLPSHPPPPVGSRNCVMKESPAFAGRSIPNLHKKFQHELFPKSSLFTFIYRFSDAQVCWVGVIFLLWLKINSDRRDGEDTEDWSEWLRTITFAFLRQPLLTTWHRTRTRVGAEEVSIEPSKLSSSFSSATAADDGPWQSLNQWFV